MGFFVLAIFYIHMIYQIYYDEKSLRGVIAANPFITPCGVYKARNLERVKNHIYDDEKEPNLTDHNSLCEWRVLYYIWKNYPSKWVGFTSWQHNKKGFFPLTKDINENWINTTLKQIPISGFIVRSLKNVTMVGIDMQFGLTLKNQFLQWSQAENILKKRILDTRNKAMGRFHTRPYWDFVLDTYKAFYGPDLNKELDWNTLGQVDKLHTWCNAFIAKWDYFDSYMKTFSPIVLSMLSYFGSHPIELELSYICERLIIIHNYIQYSNHAFN